MNLHEFIFPKLIKQNEKYKVPKNGSFLFLEL